MSAPTTPAKKGLWETIKDKWNYAKAHPWEINFGRAIKNGLIGGAAIGGGILFSPALFKALSFVIPGITSLINTAGQATGVVMNDISHATQVLAGDLTRDAVAATAGMQVPPGVRSGLADMLHNAEAAVRP